MRTFEINRGNHVEVIDIGDEAPALVVIDHQQAQLEQKDRALMNLMTAYERLVRSSCTPEQIEHKPWRCAEYCAAESALSS